MNKREVRRAALISYTAEIEGVSPTHVRSVLNDVRNNDDVVSTFQLLKEKIKDTVTHVNVMRLIEKDLALEEEIAKSTGSEIPTRVKKNYKKRQPAKAKENG